MVLSLFIRKLQNSQEASELVKRAAVGEEKFRSSSLFASRSAGWWVEGVNWFVSGFDTFHNIVSASLSARWNGGLYHLVCWLID